MEIMLKRFCFLFSAIVIVSTSNAQTNLFSVDHLDVLYREDTELNNDTLPKVFIESSIFVRDSINISIINFEVIDEKDSSSKYQVSYNVSDSPMLAINGQLLFKKELNTIKINLPYKLPLKSYLYKINTIDTNGIVSELFSEFK